MEKENKTKDINVSNSSLNSGLSVFALNESIKEKQKSINKKLIVKK